MSIFDVFPLPHQVTGRSTTRVCGSVWSHAERETRTYKGSQGAESLIRGLNAFLYYHNPRSRPIFPSICFLAEQKIVGHLGPGSTSASGCPCGYL